MQNTFRQLVEHGYTTLFVAAFAERLGLFLDRISLSKDSCVRLTQVLSPRHADRSLLYSKWVPGVACWSRSFFKQGEIKC